MITIWVGNLSKNLKIQIKRVCPKCQKVFYCDNSCASINKNCLCAKCFKGAGNTGLACGYRCKQLNSRQPFIFR
jgi:hypothetical protein